MDEPSDHPPGSALNPHVLPDTPVKSKANKKPLIYTGPPSSIIPRNRDRDLAAVEARIRALEASVLTPASTNAFSGAVAGSSRSLTEAEEVERIREERRAEQRAIREVRRRRRLRHTSMVAVLEAPQPISVIPPARRGSRRPRRNPLTHQDLWQYGLGPPDQIAASDREYQKCGICHFVKSHPVSYACGHSHCYVCIRLWLERKWTCPECVTPMERAPVRQYAEEAALAHDYPAWNDRSTVDYGFSGLVFPA
ncbi:hypothetical protein FB451DRAFT_1420341 [Mycena latifolia]|nr:hypothetical protein FB451DRAFT_1420341 [Mycena latifolia]